MKTKNEIVFFIILYTSITVSFISLINSKTAIANHSPTNSDWAMAVSSLHQMPNSINEKELSKPKDSSEFKELSNTVNPFEITKKEKNERKNYSKSNWKKTRVNN